MEQIKGFSNYYVTKSGRVYSKHRDRFLKPTSDFRGYERVSLSKYNTSYKKLVHQLVLETFIGLRPNGMECRHLDGNSSNNKLENLCWGTPKENGKDARLHGVHKGENNSQAKLTEQDVRMIVYMYKTKLFKQKEIAKIYNISQSIVTRIVTKKIWKHIWIASKK